MNNSSESVFRGERTRTFEQLMSTIALDDKANFTSFLEMRLTRKGKGKNPIKKIKKLKEKILKTLKVKDNGIITKMFKENENEYYFFLFIRNSEGENCIAIIMAEICENEDNIVINVSGKFFNENLKETYEVAIKKNIDKYSVKFIQSRNVILVKQYYFEEKNVNYMHINEKIGEIFHKEAYPYIVDLENIGKNFLESEASVIILAGIPGVGKTRLSRLIAAQLNIAINEKYPDSDYNPTFYYTSSEDVLKDGKIFKDAIRDNSEVTIILEDIDNYIRPRSEDKSTDIVAKLLNASDGFLRGKKSKFIISTNLKIEEIDSALVRPGRCFLVADCRKHTPKEANAFLKVLGVEKTVKEEHSLAELYKIANPEK